MTIPQPPAVIATPYSAVVIGASGGIGDAIARLLAARPNCGALHLTARHPENIDCPASSTRALDITDEASIVDAASTLGAKGPIDLVIVATGLLHGSALQPEKTINALNAEVMLQAFNVNTIGPALLAKHFLPLLNTQSKSVFAALSARVSSISDNRLGGWHSYRASKAALNMLLKGAAIELARTNKHAACIGYHPGTVETPLSSPFLRNVQAGKLFTPEVAADHLLAVLRAVQPRDSGKLFAWDGTEIAP